MPKSLFSIAAPASTRRGRSRALRVEPLEPRVVMTATLLISEFMVAGTGELPDEDGDNSDWIEMFNPTDQAIDLGGYRLTDDGDDNQKWTFPAGLTLDAKGYLVVFASGKDRTDDPGRLHTNFKLDAEGEDLRLFDEDGLLESAVSPYPAQVPGVSYGISDDGSLRYFDTPTPGQANVAGLIGIVADTTFSQDRGFYETIDAFDLTIDTATPGASIYYTLDGTVPDVDNPAALLYDPQARPRIERTTILRAAAFKAGFLPSNVDTQTYLFLDDVLTQSPDGAAPEGWPTESVNSQVFDFGMDPEVVNSPQWGGQLREALTQVPTLSLVTDLDNLVDPATGIYVNAGKHGRQWERPTSLELINPDGSEGFQIDAGLRIRGGFSRSRFNPKHSFRLFFREEYGDSKLNFPLFGDEGVDSFDKIDLRTSQNDSWAFQGSRQNTMINDVFARDLQREMGQPYTRSRYYHLYINGVYWGLFQTQERPEASFGASYFGGDREDYDTIKSTGSSGGYRTEATDGNLDAWQQLWQAVRDGADGDPEDDTNLLRLQGLSPDGTRNEAYPVLLDVDNLIDYMIIIIATGNEDAPLSKPFGDNKSNNWYAVRNRNGDAGFRFFMHDAEQTFFSGHNVDGLQADRVGPFVDENQEKLEFSNPQWIHQDLMVNETYRRRFGDRVQKYMMNDGLLTPDAIEQAFLRRAAEIDQAVIAESARWGDGRLETPLGKDDWLAALDRIFTEYLPFRNEIVFDQLRSAERPLSDGTLVDAPLYPSVVAPVFSQQGGAVSSAFQLTITAPEGTVYYTLDGSDPRGVGSAISDTAIVYDGNSVKLLRSGTVRAAALDGQQWSALNEAAFTVDLPLRITEIMFNPADPTVEEIAAGFTDNDAFEFIEIINIGSDPISLEGIQFTDGIEFTLPDATAFPGERLVIVRDEAAFRFRYGEGPIVLGQYGDGLSDAGPHKLSNSGETIVWEEPAGGPLDIDPLDFNSVQQFSYDDQWQSSTDGQGRSLVIIDPAMPAAQWNEASAWTFSYDPSGSPGGEDLLAGDLNGDHRTDLLDLAMLARGMRGGPVSRSSGDLNLDGVVDRTDWGLLLRAFARNRQTIPTTASPPPRSVTLYATSFDTSSLRRRKRAAPPLSNPAVDQTMDHFEAQPILRASRRRLSSNPSLR